MMLVQKHEARVHGCHGCQDGWEADAKALELREEKQILCEAPDKQQVAEAVAHQRMSGVSPCSPS